MEVKALWPSPTHLPEVEAHRANLSSPKSCVVQKSQNFVERVLEGIPEASVLILALFCVIFHKPLNLSGPLFGQLLN